MKFMVFVKLTGQAAADYENGKMPTEDEIHAMMDYNEQLANAGIILDGQGLHPTSRGARVEFPQGKSVVSDGPFPESKELLGGYWIWNVDSQKEALEWASKCPMQEGDVLELRQIFEMEDFEGSISEEDKSRADEIFEKEASART